MATAISDANFQTAVGEVYDAIEAENWASAHKWLAKAEAQLAGLILQAGNDGANMTRRSSLESLEARLLKLEGRKSKWERHSRWIP